MPKNVRREKIIQCECNNIRLTGATNCKISDANGKLLLEANVMLLTERK